MMKRLTNEELIAFCEQLAMILRSGISVLEGISIMSEEAAEEEGQKILRQIYGGVEESGFLYMALQETEGFPDYMVQMTQIGEMSGRLDEVLGSLALYYEREEGISDSIRSAVLYPSIMFGMLAVILAVLVMKVMPIFDQVLAQMGSELTGISAVLLKVGQSMNRYSYVFIGIGVILLALCLFFYKSPKGRTLFGKWQENFFATKKLTEAIAAARFADGMSLCLASGLDMDESLEMVGKLVVHKRLGEKIDQCRRLLKEGEDFGTAVKQAGILKGIYSHMILIGYRAGSVEEAMSKVAQLYEDEVDQKIEDILSVLEPAMIVILSVIIGSILLSVMLPLMAVMTEIG